MKSTRTVRNASEFVEGIHWRRLTPTEQAGKPWKAVTFVDIHIPCVTGLKHCYFLQQGKTIWGTLTPRGIEIRAGYQWNFNTCAPDRWGKFASLPHDLLYQFSGCFFFPRIHLSRKWCDDLYARLCEQSVSWAYRTGLWLGGWWCWGNRPKDGEYVEIL